jgi:hypothetical protein
MKELIDIKGVISKVNNDPISHDEADNIMDHVLDALNEKGYCFGGGTLLRNDDEEPVLTDLQKTINLYKGFGIDCEVETTKDGYSITLMVGEKFDGYHCFHSIITFDKGGKFVGQGFWE